MNIDRSNYEMFFLQWVDNELSPAEKDAVLQFLQLHPDLQAELDALKEAVVLPDNISFQHKQHLLKPETVDELTETMLLMQIDGELGAADNKQLIQRMATEPAVEKALQQLLLAKAVPDQTVVFPNKSLLLREEKDRVIPIFTWRKLAVAAILLGFGIWGAGSYFSGTGIDRTVSTATEKPASNPSKPQPTVPSTREDIDNSTVASPSETTANNTNPATNYGKEKSANPVQQGIATSKKARPSIPSNSPNPTMENEPVPTDKDRGIATNQPVYRTINNNGSNNNQPATVPSLNQPLAGNNTEIKPVETNPFATQASFSENNRELFTFSDDADKKKKNKLTALLRKATRVLKRKVGGGDDSEHLKVANMEVAIH